jgi:N-carbamoyl-L-amino-acid hydrolase
LASWSDYPFAISHSIERALPLAEHLFSELRERTGDGIGVTRASYGPGEQIAHDLLSEAARSLNLEIVQDAARNLYMTLPGADRQGPSWMTGSHLDSVPHGGNYDGAAGVIAGITVLAALRQTDFKPDRDITLVAIRGEEAGSWFRGRHNSLLGSRAALGRLDAEELQSAICVETGTPLAERMAGAGVNVDDLVNRRAAVVPARYKGFIELHIEQGPVLEQARVPVGVVSAIRGGLWARECVCLGSYAHAGAEPRSSRRDAVMALSEFITACEAKWIDIEKQGGDLVFTIGKLHTDSNVNALTKVAGEAKFCLDIRSGDRSTLEEIQAYVQEKARTIAGDRRVKFDFGPMTLISPTEMNPVLRQEMLSACAELGIKAIQMPSGGGHDAEEFAKAGIPASMIFIRNQNGSHNPDEAIRMEDFAQGARLLMRMLLH